ncbi:winged helix-turn-helix transcriptional regulator [Candidatus Micrarchaeota archaeon]|nr:winged helix-turn-helix transcriptional regulator [Candidatus Micrarchaeota archaeon]
MYENKISNSFCTKFFAALANKQRIRVLQRLVEGPVAVKDLADQVKSERTLLSHNLALLIKADLVRVKKVGKQRVYSANMEIVPQIFAFLENLVCSSCSIRQTCEILKQDKEKLMLVETKMTDTKIREPCVNCR